MALVCDGQQFFAFLPIPQQDFYNISYGYDLSISVAGVPRMNLRVIRGFFLITGKKPTQQSRKLNRPGKIRLIAFSQVSGPDTCLHPPGKTKSVFSGLFNHRHLLNYIQGEPPKYSCGQSDNTLNNQSTLGGSAA
jgi:hypothetical protein